MTLFFTVFAARIAASSRSITGKGADGTVTDPDGNFLHLGLLPVQEMRQFDKNGSVLHCFGVTVVPAQEEGEVFAHLRVTRPQANRH